MLLDRLRSLLALALIGSVAFGLTQLSEASAQAVAATKPAQQETTSQLLQRAMRARVAVNTNVQTGATVAAVHCRHAPEGCDRRLSMFADYLVGAGEKNGLDPWLLAAMAFKESGFNPFAMGSLGELGILQLHPQNPRSKNVRFIHDEAYRRRCRKEIGACQQEVVERAAELLARTVEQCGGDMKNALGAYNTGRCGGNSRYTKRILGERKALREAAGLDVALDASGKKT